ncbi:MAG: type I glyceraldehyde-3-phosphate dehydrogenase [Patescibacteria group bacterium]|nr:type I glyceraldehyde-3-phosphate dehydrogenase [Patescibacteria group bacterium]MDE1944275.1 type I glyceraldehyde-3-phosphate dehydrogenase [Patescibacteria group bacterium]MDE1944662.1 type I glyceraldehyde-3-phosphate dehydrogenase [Patescibacteria group bacterium]MDE2057348.1 type I glyceraldehyde-3-phosphate dehydrogenase [Patescibacteria group bacterium]
MADIRVAINGFGRIGRAFARRSWGRGVEIVAVNDLGSLENLAYLLAHDTVYKRPPFPVAIEGGNLRMGDQVVRFCSEKDPAALPWKELAVDVVVESTGFFTEFAAAGAHVTAGARRVVISAPAKGDEGVAGATVLMGVNEDRFAACPVTSNASCTTNAASPVIAILNEKLGIEKAILSTTHAYTASQSIVDGPSKKDMKEGRAGAANIVPTSTGAAIAVTKAYPELVDKFDGISLRVPVPAGSIADITFIAKRDTSAEEVNGFLRDAAREARWEGIFAASDEELVSSDIVGEATASIADLGMTRVVGGNLVKVLAWYDNEMGYTESLVRHVLAAAAA